MSQSFSSRLRTLESSQKRTAALIQKLADHEPTPGGVSDTADLSSEIRDALKQQEDALELLRQEIDDGPLLTAHSPWIGGGAVTSAREEQDQDHERNENAVAKLSTDLKTSHRIFRQAQVLAKRKGDAARRKEREELFAKRGTGESAGSAPRKKQNLTQDELAVNAANDVTAALRRTHNVLQDTLQSSTFAQQALEESGQALATLGEKYGGMDDMLKSTRGLVSTLLRSQKSDTWYLTTAFYMLLITIAWLVFRRLLYGPLWWLVYLPLRVVWWGLSAAAVGILGAPQNSTVVVATPVLQTPGSRPTIAAGGVRPVEMKAKGAGWGGSNQPPKAPAMVDEIGEMAAESVEGAEKGLKDPEGTAREDVRGEGRPAINTKKRMMEVDVDQARKRDEL